MTKSLKNYEILITDINHLNHKDIETYLKHIGLKKNWGVSVGNDRLDYYACISLHTMLYNIYCTTLLEEILEVEDKECLIIKVPKDWDLEEHMYV